ALNTSPTVSVEPVPMPIVTLPEASVVEVDAPVEKVMFLPSTVRTAPLVIAVARLLARLVVAEIATVLDVASLLTAVPVTEVAALVAAGARARPAVPPAVPPIVRFRLPVLILS